MEEHKETRTPREETGTVIVKEVKKKKTNPYAVIAIIAAALVLALVGLTVFAVHAQSDRRALREQLSEAERILELREDVVSALEAQQNEQKGIVEELQNRLEELLNIEEADPVITKDQIVEQINSARELVTKEYIYRNAERRTDQKDWIMGWTLPFSDTSLLVIYDGTIKYGIDLSEASVAVDEASRTVTVTLPPSKIISHEISQGDIQVLEVKNNLFNEVSFDEYNAFIESGKRTMEDVAAERGLLEQAGKEAKTIIRDVLSLLPGMDTYELTIQ